MSSVPIHRLFYISRAHVDPCGEEPRRILAVAAQRNETLQVTGLLCFSGDHFAQVLEGPAAAVEELMVSIRADARHTLLREWPPQPARLGRWFPGWAMGYAYDERLEGMARRLIADPHEAPPLDGIAPDLFCNLELYRGPGHSA